MPVILIVPFITGVLCFLLRKKCLIELVSITGLILLAVSTAPVVRDAVESPIFGYGFFYMDALSAYILSLIVFLAVASGFYSLSYLDHEFAAGIIDIKYLRRYHLLFHMFIASMILVTISDNLAVIWIAIEATTIVSAPLIGLGYLKRDLAIEAAWKYIILCTVGITFALLGTFITYYAATSVIGLNGGLSWTVLKANAAKLNPATMKLAFIFILVGYGTKAGLAPLHNWLPDAHSQAPSPISALLSGILLNTAFYGIMRFVSIVEPSTGKAFTGNLLVLFGIFSFLLSAIFIFVQDNYKRLLAYSSIEHMGVISIGAGIGTFAGMYGALLHILNHAVAKPLMFFVSGKIQEHYGSTRIERVNGVLSKMPVLGILTFIGVFSLAGMPPFNIFISELTILMAAVDNDMWIVTALFLFSAVIAFFGMLSGFSRMLFDAKKDTSPTSNDLSNETHARKTSDYSAMCVMICMAGLIIILGFFVPGFIEKAIKNSILVLGVK